MKIEEFKLERYFAEHEFTAKFLLSSSDCDPYPLQKIIDSASENELEQWNSIKLGYTPSEGSLFLREAIQKLYSKASAENILVSSPGELNFLAMNVLLEPSDHVITVSPCYQSLSDVVKAIGCELSYWRPNSEWEFKPEELKKLIKKNTKLIIINFPHNPTGSYLTPSELNRVIEIARESDLFVFSDEMYHKLVHTNQKELLPVSDLYEKGISLWGTSKSFGMAGLRTGWLVTQDKKLLDQFLAFKDYLSICTSPTSEVLTAIAVNNFTTFIQPNIKKIERNILLFETFVKRHSNLMTFVRPKAGSTGFVEMNIKESTLAFSNQLVGKTGIMTVPAEMFQFPGKYLRIGFGRENLPSVLEILDEYLVQHYVQQRK